MPPIYETVCLSKITAEEKLLRRPILFGACRGFAGAGRLAKRQADLPYRIGELELCPDAETAAAPEEQILREELLRGLQRLQPELAVHPMFAQALDGDVPLGVFCDVLAHALRLPPGDCRRILEERNVPRSLPVGLKSPPRRRPAKRIRPAALSAPIQPQLNRRLRKIRWAGKIRRGGFFVDGN